MDWSQTQMADLFAKLQAWGENPHDYVAVSCDVSELAYRAWPKKYRDLFEPARTVRTGLPKFTFTKDA